jgi:hypothetical protein
MRVYSLEFFSCTHVRPLPLHTAAGASVPRRAHPAYRLSEPGAHSGGEGYSGAGQGRGRPASLRTRFSREPFVRRCRSPPGIGGSRPAIVTAGARAGTRAAALSYSVPAPGGPARGDAVILALELNSYEGVMNVSNATGNVTWWEKANASNATEWPWGPGVTFFEDVNATGPSYTRAAVNLALPSPRAWLALFGSDFARADYSPGVRTVAPAPGPPQGDDRPHGPASAVQLVPSEPPRLCPHVRLKPQRFVLKILILNTDTMAQSGCHVRRGLDVGLDYLACVPPAARRRRLRTARYHRRRRSRDPERGAAPKKSARLE